MIARMIIKDVREATSRTQLRGHLQEVDKLDPECAPFVRAAVTARMTELGMVDIVFGDAPDGWALRLMRVAELSADLRFYVPSKDATVSGEEVLEAWCLWQDGRVHDKDDDGFKVGVSNRRFNAGLKVLKSLIHSDDDDDDDERMG